MSTTWYVDDFGTPEYLDGIKARYAVYAGQRQIIAYAFKAEEAALLAAAPSLKAALEAVLSYAEDCAADRDERPPCLKQARNALAEAEGE